MSFNIINEEARKAFLAQFEAAVKENNTAAAGEALKSFVESVSADIMAQAKAAGTLSQDASVLAARGLRVLTSEEKSYFNSVIDCAKSEDPAKAFAGLNATLPETEVNAIFDDIAEAHPLLNIVDTQNTAALMKLLINAKGPQAAIWGELNSAITKELEGSVEVVELTLGKLTAFIYVSNDMLELGPVWLEKYIRTCLAESIGYGVDAGLIGGKGIAGEPIGMMKDISDGVSVSSTTGYPDKEAIEITSLDPVTYGTLLAKLATSKTGRARTISSVDFIVNPVDYFEKILPAKTMLRQDGLYQTDCVPFPTNFIQCADVPKGGAIIGLGKMYKFGLGKGKGGKIETSDEYKFLEDLTTYKIKLYGTGRAVDDNCFLVLDISGLLPLTQATAAADTDGE